MTLPESLPLFRDAIALPQGWNLKEKARNNCGLASWAFEIYLNACGIESKPFATDVDMGTGWMIHVMTQVGDVYVDWTARQISRAFDFPHIFTMLEMDRLGWKPLTAAETDANAIVMARGDIGKFAEPEVALWAIGQVLFERGVA